MRPACGSGGDTIIPYPTGRILTGLFPGTSCQATIISSLRDRKASDFQPSARLSPRGPQSRGRGTILTSASRLKPPICRQAHTTSAEPLRLCTFARDLSDFRARICRLTRPKIGRPAIQRVCKIRIWKKRVPLRAAWITIIRIAAERPV
jgi:hypothetical protein